MADSYRRIQRRDQSVVKELTITKSQPLLGKKR